MFNDLITTAMEYLNLGNVTKATELLHNAEKLALSHGEKVLAHALSNAIQREICDQYLTASEV